MLGCGQAALINALGMLVPFKIAMGSLGYGLHARAILSTLHCASLLCISAALVAAEFHWIIVPISPASQDPCEVLKEASRLVQLLATTLSFSWAIRNSQAKLIVRC